MLTEYKRFRSNIAQATALLSAFGFPPCHALAADSAAGCIQESVVFDGSTPLRFAAVIGEPGSKRYLHHKYPASCAGSADQACKAAAYVIPGDVVAIGKTCGKWDYVQFIGEKRVSVGWAASEDLGAPSLPTAPNGKSGQGFLMVDGYRFKLTKGHGVPVCEAYLQRVNVSHYEKPPYCGRPEDDTVPGFAKLVRIPLEAPEINRLYKYAYNFLYPRPRYENSGFTDIREGRVNETGRFGQDLAAWRYAPLADLNNDGVPDNIIVWHAVAQGGGGGRCASDIANTGVGERVAQAPLIFNAGDEGVDDKATKAIIAHSVQQYDSSLQTGNLYGGALTFRTIARAIGIFRYRDTYYFDGFFDIWGDADNKRRGEPQLANTLAVFVHKPNVTHEICEYQLDGSDYPIPDGRP